MSFNFNTYNRDTWLLFTKETIYVYKNACCDMSILSLFKLIFIGVILTETSKRPMAMADISNQVFTFPRLVSGVAGGRHYCFNPN